MQTLDRLIFIIGVVTFLPSPFAMATVHTAASCNVNDVQAKLNLAVNGDTVAVPAGNCTWGSAVTISGKALTLQGAGVGSTNITLTREFALNITASATNFVTVKGFSFIGGTSNADEPTVYIHGTSFSEDVGFRVTGNAFTNCQTHCLGVSSLYGLIDNNSFATNGDTIQLVEIVGSEDVGWTAWNTPLSLGTNKFVYMENNSFTAPTGFCDGAIDGFNGARAVMRYNNFNNGCTPGTHGTDTGGHRSFMYLELYQNNYADPKNVSTAGTYLSRGGTALIYDNHWVSGSAYGIGLKYYRACTDSGADQWGFCTGTNYRLLSSLDTTSTSSGYYFCSNNRDKYCTSSADCGGAACNGYFDGSGQYGYPGRDQPGRGPRQVLMPVYEWNNSSQLSGIGGWCGQENCTQYCGARYVNSLTSGLVQLNRDAYAYVSSGFNGTVGVGRGTTAARPATCTTGVAYWSTTDNTLYQCSSTNTWTAYYTPYTYPHPLAGTTKIPNPPSNIIIQ